MRILVIGFGWVWGYLGGILHDSGQDVTFLVKEQQKVSDFSIEDREEHLEISHAVMCTQLELSWVFDLVFVTVKSYDTLAVMKTISAYMHPDSVCCVIQNGLHQYDALDRGYTLPVLAYINVSKTAPNLIVKQSDFFKLLMPSSVPGDVKHIVQWVLSGIIGPRCEVTRTSHFTQELWKKFIHICSYGGAVCLCNRSVWEIKKDLLCWNIYEWLLQEAVRVACISEMWDEDYFSAACLEMMKRTPDAAYASLYFDLLQGKQTEIETLQGELVRIAANAWIVTPYMDCVYAYVRWRMEKETLSS